MIKRKWFEILIVMLYAVIVFVVAILVKPDYIVGEATESRTSEVAYEEVPPVIVELSSETVKQSVEEEPVEETELPEPVEPTYISLGIAEVTAYCSCEECCGKWAECRPTDENGNKIVYGASGELLIPYYSVAVDPDVIPYGTKIYIDGQEYIAHDCGGSIAGNDIDIYFDSHEKAREWGIQEHEIFIEKVE